MNISPSTKPDSGTPETPSRIAPEAPVVPVFVISADHTTASYVFSSTSGNLTIKSRFVISNNIVLVALALKFLVSPNVISTLYLPTFKISSTFINV